MATWSIAGRESLLSLAARKLARLPALGRTARTALLLLVRVALVLVGLGLLVAAAYVALGLAAGLAAGGVAAFILEWAVKRDA
jgi:hypothetical protein